jgi:hypothetical protein
VLNQILHSPVFDITDSEDENIAPCPVKIHSESKQHSQTGQVEDIRTASNSTFAAKYKPTSASVLASNAPQMPVYSYQEYVPRPPVLYVRKEEEVGEILADLNGYALYTLVAILFNPIFGQSGRI